VFRSSKSSEIATVGKANQPIVFDQFVIVLKSGWVQRFNSMIETQIARLISGQGRLHRKESYMPSILWSQFYDIPRLVHFQPAPMCVAVGGWLERQGREYDWKGRQCGWKGKND